MTYQRPKCDVPECTRGADVRDADGVWCARHSVEGFEALTYPCGGCCERFHPDKLDDYGLCGVCARNAAEADDAGLSDPAIGDR